MYEWLYNPTIPFHMWKTTHLLTILFIGLIVLSFYLFKGQLKPHRNFIRISVGWTLILSRLSLDIWYVITDQWSVRTSLPLELCSIASLICGLMLLTKNRHLLEIFYFIAIGGA